MQYNEYAVDAKVWLYPGMAGWHFVTIPQDISDDILRQFAHLHRGWGSLRVRVTLGNSSWDTSIFLDKKIGAYLLPLKAAIRKKEGVTVDQNISLVVEIKT